MKKIFLLVCEVVLTALTMSGTLLIMVWIFGTLLETTSRGSLTFFNGIPMWVPICVAIANIILLALLHLLTKPEPTVEEVKSRWGHPMVKMPE